ncbi:hypothetical protein DUNSADRAFT_14545 [Dunaliella salina]|uniref:Uncharacterized protein n=1 Tax=Dunaliella salina TaxID=3046 RepID=A0ABQ7G795_DUNSA|nr:hypothetical protein DUNSADRAFT_14545 [Dunaliella salina]|eukprot:KAF5830465.1 hypothetical protein DUNSADRAFT_14545 [Dunaliella salina]
MERDMKPSNAIDMSFQQHKQSPWNSALRYVMCFVVCAVIACAAHITASLQPAWLYWTKGGPSFVGEHIDMQRVMGLWSLPPSRIITYTGECKISMDVQ